MYPARRKQRKKPVKYDNRRYKRRNRIEVMFSKLKDWRSVATRYDLCPKVFLSAIVLAAIVIYWLRNSMSPDPRPQFVEKGSGADDCDEWCFNLQG